LATGTPVFEATGEFRERLLAIKRGERSLDDVLAEAEAMSPSLEAARDASTLPEQPDFEKADALLKRISNELARRHVLKVPGPWSAPESAPVSPSPRGGEGRGEG
jgi:hypothetical protein